MMTIPFVEKVIDFWTDLGIAVRARHPYLGVEFVNAKGNLVRRFAIFDSGAPFSVLPFTLWHEKSIPCQLLGSQLLSAKQQQTAALTWLGIPCQLGEAQVVLWDRATGSRSKPLRLLAKLPLAKVAPPYEMEAILGDSFLVDNSLILLLKGVAGQLEGSVTSA